MTYRLMQGDCRDLMAAAGDNKVHAICCDPPYALTDKQPNAHELLTKWLAGEDYENRGSGFMGETWDSFVPGPSTWKEALRVLRPGGHALVFAGSRTADLMGIALRLAGFEIRDELIWMYGQGMPKSHNLGVMIDKASGNVRTRVPMEGGIPPGSNQLLKTDDQNPRATDKNSSEPITEAARQWADWGTGLKPAHEPIIVARKPLEGKLLANGKLSEKTTVTVAENIQKWGVGAYNLAAWAIEHDEAAREINRNEGAGEGFGHTGRMPGKVLDKARHPANVIVGHHEDCLEVDSGTLCHGDCPTRLLDMQTAVKQKGIVRGGSRFFYVPKASRPERDAGLAEFQAQFSPTMSEGIGGREHLADAAGALVKNTHKTVKPLGLMEYLVEGIAPAGGLILDPFMGSGTTGIAALRKGYKFIGMEQDEEFVRIAQARINHWSNQA